MTTTRVYKLPGAAMTSGLDRCARRSEAVWAFCVDCQQWISGGLYWGLSKCIGLHQTGSGSKACRFAYYRWAIREVPA